MPAPNLQDDRRKQDSSNTTRDYFEQKLNDSLGQDDITKGIKDLENYANKNDSKKVEDAKKPVDEQEDGADWKNNTTEDPKVPIGGVRGKLLSKGLGIAKKRGGLIGLLAALGVGGGLLVGFFGPASMVINIMENFTDVNDSMSVSLEQRVLKVLGYSNGSTDAICANNTKLTLRCKMGNISSSALKQLDKKGFKAYYNSGEAVDTTKRYPARNPDGYEFDPGNGGEKQRIPAAQLTQWLADNPKHSVKVLGVGGAFNVTFRAWTGNHITKRFFQPFGIDKRGGLLSGIDKLSGTTQDKIKQSLEKLRKHVPGAQATTEAAAKIKTKVEGQLGKAKKGGVGYMLAVGGCMSVKAPGFFAAAAAGVQLLPVINYVSDTVLSPGGKLKASGVEGASAVTPASIDAGNSLLTDKSLDKESNKMLAAVDSPHLQSAMGVNKSKVPISKYTPGFGILTSPLVVNANKADKATSSACSAIMSPAAMWSAFAVDSAVTVAASSTVVLGVVKVLISLAASEVINHVAGEVIQSVAKDALVAVAENKDLATAQGKELGDIIGIGAMAYFSSASMSRYVPGLKMSQLSSFSALKAESDNFDKQMAVASLSPFDTSSKYTFLGSIVHNVNTAMITNGGYSGNIFSVMSSVLSVPNTFFNPTAGAAANFSENYCGYAADFGLEILDDSGQIDPNNTPAINAAGLPCTGITSQQASMSTDEALNLMINEGWIDESKEITPNDAIPDLIDKGVIKAETPLADFIETCGAAETGDYLFNAAGCTTNGTAKNSTSVKDSYSAENQCAVNEAGDTVCIDDLAELDESEGTGVKNPRSLIAIPVFLLDYQMNASINGQDEQDFASAGKKEGDSEYVLPVDPGYAQFDSGQDWGARDICSSSDKNSYCYFHRGVDFAYGGSTSGKPVYSVTDGEVIEVGMFNTSCALSDSGQGKWDNRVMIRHKDGTVSGYSHMTVDSIVASGIKVGDTVKAGQQIGTIGNCGNSQGAHLHFTISPGTTSLPEVLAMETNTRGDTYVNPTAYMALYGVDLTTGTYTDGR